MILPALKLSLVVSLTATLLVVPLGGATAYLLARKSFYGRNVLDALFMLPLVLPPTVTGYYLISLFGRQGFIGAALDKAFGWTPVFNLSGAILASIVVAFPLMLRSAVIAFKGVPRELELTAYTLGVSPWKTFWRVTLPLAARGIVGGAILSLARSMGEFGATLMIAGNIKGRTQTLPMAIYEAFLIGDDRSAFIMVILLTLMSLGVIYMTLRLSRFSLWS